MSTEDSGRRSRHRTGNWKEDVSYAVTLLRPHRSCTFLPQSYDPEGLGEGDADILSALGAWIGWWDDEEDECY
jgi:hypothetical protein